MTDYLTNLVSRSFGVAEVVRPRSRSLFEPVQSASPEDGLGLDAAAGAAPRRARLDNPPALEPGSFEASRAPDISPQGLSIGSDAPKAIIQDEAAPAQRASFGTRAFNFEPHSPPPATERLAAPAPPGKATHSLEQAAPVSAPMLAPEAIPPDHGAAFEKADSTQAPNLAAFERRKILSIERARLAAVPGPAPQEPAAPLGGHRPTVPADLAAGRQPERREALQEAVQPGPAIHVTIGRVEVRAAPAPAASSKRSSTPRSTSLADYLNGPHRGGGSR